MKKYSRNAISFVPETSASSGSSSAENAFSLSAMQCDAGYCAFSSSSFSKEGSVPLSFSIILLSLMWKALVLMLLKMK